MWPGPAGRAEAGEGGPEALFSSLGLYPPGDLWPAQPMCMTGGFNCALENTVPSLMQGPAPVHNRYKVSSQTAAWLSPWACGGTLSPIC